MVTKDATPGASEILEIFHRGAELEIVRRWFNSRTIGNTVLAVIWNGFAFFFYAKMSSHSAAAESLSLFHLGLYAFPSIGVFLAYRAAAQWLNRTYVVVDHEHFSVRHGPLPWPGNLKVAVAQIKRLHADVSRWVTGKGQYRQYTYDVLADRQDGKSRKLVGGFATPDQAMRVIHEIDSYLNLRPVHEQARPTATPGPDTGETNIQGVLSIWLFSLIWNGAIWSIAMMLWDSPRLKHGTVAMVFFSIFALIGLGMVCLAIPATWKFIRQKATRRRNPATGRLGWGAVIALMAIATGIAAILTIGIRMHNEDDALRRQLQTPATWHK